MTILILGWIKSLFRERTYKDSLEYFIESKQPKSTAEVEYWTRYYDQHTSNQGLV